MARPFVLQNAPFFWLKIMVLLPCADSGVFGRRSVAFFTFPRTDTLRILYVEDNEELRETIAMLMEQEGRCITKCATAEAALQLDAQEPFDVLFTDVSLPGLSGTDLARQVLAKDPERWVVLCSGYQFGKAIAALGSHVRALVKPFELEELEDLLVEIETALKTSPAL